MKILIGYDGSPSSEIALADLSRAGLPENVDAKLISIAEVWMPLPEFENDGKQVNLAPTKNVLFMQRQVAIDQAVLKAESLCRYVADKVRKKFPTWRVSSDVAYGSPAREILSKAEVFEPDLIVVGSQGQTAVSRVLLGSISRKVLTEAKCSVRIARRNFKRESLVCRQIIGYDGSHGADICVDAVAKRSWSHNCEFRLVLAPNSGIPAKIGRFVSPSDDLFVSELEKARPWAEEIATSARHKLTAADLEVEISVNTGNPKQVLIDEAESYGAHCIFVGSNSAQKNSERFSIGCTAAAIAERAGCSVEVVKSG